MKESIEKSLSRKGGKEKEKTVEEKIEEIRIKEIQKAKEDKTGTPWNRVDIKSTVNSVKDLFLHWEHGDYDVAQGEIKSVWQEIGKIKDKEEKEANEALVSILDNKIAEGLLKEESERTQELDIG